MKEVEKRKVQEGGLNVLYSTLLMTGDCDPPKLSADVLSFKIEVGDTLYIVAVPASALKVERVG
jgi:hypothetical protein